MPRRNANRTVPTKDETGRRPPAQPKIPVQRTAPPGAGPVRRVKLATRDPRRSR
jgi:hypothetical protein